MDNSAKADCTILESLSLSRTNRGRVASFPVLTDFGRCKLVPASVVDPFKRGTIEFDSIEDFLERTSLVT